jgi:4'-phosphopantetheinyl transferase
MALGSDEVLVLLAIPDELLAADAATGTRDPSGSVRRSGQEPLACLAPEDVEHASRFRAERDRDVAFASRVVQRLALSLATGDEVAPAAWRFAAADNGRPVLHSPPEAWSGLRFSAANTVGLVGCAVRPSGSVGLDLERRRDSLPAELVDRCLSGRERAELLGLSECERPERFMRLWTAKEAYLKARGIGIVDELDQVEIRIVSERAELSLGPALRDDGERWRLVQLQPTREHIGALCVERVDGAAPPTIRQQWARLPSSRAMPRA